MRDGEAQVTSITEDIRNGNTKCLNDFLNATISDSMREDIADLFRKGAELDDDESIRITGKAEGLLDKLTECKPFARTEKPEECNYNMIDSILNSEEPEEEREHKAGRVSVREKLAEKRTVIGQRDKSEKEIPERGTGKKSKRGI